jgi:23S rRNA (guanosine2251-2'-O)-methyltransferase
VFEAQDRLLGDPSLFGIALDRIQDPQNFGAIVRSAVTLAEAAILWPENASAPLSPAMFRASAGAIEHARLCRVPSLPGCLREAAACGVTVVGLDAAAGEDLEAMPLSRPLILVVGGEHRGLSRPVRDVCTHLARLAQRGPVGSLNASVAAAIALYLARISVERSPA